MNEDKAVSVVIPGEYAGLRLDQALARIFPAYSRSRLQEWITLQYVKLDGKYASSKQRVWGGERLEAVPQLHPADQPFLPEDIALNVLYEDDALLVVNKPVGLVVHPGSGNWQGTLLNALLHHEPRLEAVPRAGIVHRLDKDTSGLLVVAKNIAAQTSLVRQMEARLVRRDYLAVVHGDLLQPGKVDAPIGRHPSQRIKMAVVEGGKPAVTHYRIERRYGDCTLLECRLETGRTHQIRVHLSNIGHPLVGDRVYMQGVRKGTSKLQVALRSFQRQALHATRLALQHPIGGRPMQWHAPLPEDMRELLNEIEATVNEHEHD